MVAPSRYADSCSRNQRLDFQGRADMGRWWRHWHRGRPREPSQSSLQADSELRVRMYPVIQISHEKQFALRRFVRFAVVVLSWIPVAVTRGQDSASLARALERADRFEMAISPKPQPTAKWLDGNRLAYSPVAKAPWTIFEAPRMRVLDSAAGDAAVGGPGPAMELPLGLAYLGFASPQPPKAGRPVWNAREEGDDLIVSDTAGVARVKLS